MSAPIHYTLRLEFVRCGKARCARCAARVAAHGPYWYAYSLHPLTRRFRKQYVGKSRDSWDKAHPDCAVSASPLDGALKPWLAVLANPTPMACARLLGVQPGISRGELSRVWKKAMTSAHPDKPGGHVVLAQALNVAVATLRPLTT